jgi:hypothetical protein
MQTKRALVSTVFLFSGILLSHAQVDSVAARYAASITEEGLRARLNVLANDSIEGRETGMEGQRKAAAYIMGQFWNYGIPPVPDAAGRGMLSDGYQQRFPLTLHRLGGLSMAVDGASYVFMKDYFYFSEHLLEDLEAKEVMVLAPVSLGGTRLGGSSKVVMLLDPHDPGTDLMDQVGQACATLAKTGARVLLVVQDSAERIMQHYGPYLSRGRMHLGGDEGTKAAKPGIQVVVITPQLAQAILDHGRLTLKKAYKTALKKRVIVDVPVRFTYASRSGMLSAENVLGYVEGSDRKGEVVAVTAHYDHIGVIDGEVYNGADDDGSGTAAVLAMAEAFAKAKAEGHGPRRSMLFMAVSGEEKGLLGSDWYTQHPVFPLDSTVADLNIDMIGRTDTVYGDSSHYVYVIGSKRISKQLGELVEKENNTWTHLHLDYTFDAANDPNRFYYRSDHYNFAKHGVPIAFFFNGVHADYHGPKDEVDKIRFDLLRQRTLLVFHTAWVLANSEARLAKDGPEGVK